ncbi:Hypothetical protein POVR2_LOCUS224 [uncultured virus]|nr:Hypothetical protein POVR2_LOCUS224 [uncultured virus]
MNFDMDLDETVSYSSEDEDYEVECIGQQVLDETKAEQLVCSSHIDLALLDWDLAIFEYEHYDTEAYSSEDEV